MNKYKFYFREVIHGTVELDADSGVAAEEKFMEMSLGDLLKQSQYASDGTEREIRFVVAHSYGGLEIEDWRGAQEYI